MPTKREQIEQLAAAVPKSRNRWSGFLREWEGEDIPWYVGFSELPHYLVEAYSQGMTDEFPTLFSTVEALVRNADPDLENVVAVGLFEDVQKYREPQRLWGLPFPIVAWAEQSSRLG